MILRALIVLSVLCTAMASPVNCPFGFTSSDSDVSRAQQTTPRKQFTAPMKSISTTLNTQLQATAAARPCLSYTLEELEELARTLHCHLSSDLNDIYSSKGDARRLRFDDLKGFEAHWEKQRDHVKRNPGHLKVVQAGRCAELVMTYIHHVSEEGKAALNATGVTVPMMEDYDQSVLDDDSLPQEAKDTYTAQYNCISGHNNTESGFNKTADYPSWPDEVTYNATGHGPYPFWLGPVAADIDQGVGIQVWWSRTKQAERFDHASCAMTNAGYSKDGVPCTHLMLTGTSFFYTQAEDFCCVSGIAAKYGNYQSQILTAVPYDWMRDMTLQGTVEGYEGEYYSGSVKNYTMDCSGSPSGCGPGNFYIWYLTDMKDRPIEQGEGCQVMPRTSSCTTGGSYLYHQYNPATWTEGALDDSVFAVPKVCQGVKKYCLYP